MTAIRGQTRVLITGAGGFVGPHLVNALRRFCGRDLAVLATTKTGGVLPELGRLESLDICDVEAASGAIAGWRPTHVVNLAGIAATAAAAADPEAAWDVHLRGSRNLARAILSTAPDCWLLHVGSGLVYGASAKSGVPVDEDTVLAPVDEYAATKAAADIALGALVRRGLKCVRFRPFNHAGCGQTEDFVIPAFAMQIARIEVGLGPPLVRVGNLDAERDMLDVADVTEAYALAVSARDSLVSGEIFNIASGRPQRISDILNQLLSFSRETITIQRDPARDRPSDLPSIVGDSKRIRAKLGWAPRHNFGDTLRGILDDCRARVRPSSPA
jgi:GDP-4-dehydro-6-deoxy-D-mannose reductase